jgi:hypothetical protein
MDGEEEGKEIDGTRAKKHSLSSLKERKGFERDRRKEISVSKELHAVR